MFSTCEYIYIHNCLESDRPALKDIANFIVPYVHHKWYSIGLQLLDSEVHITFLRSLRTQYHDTEDLCTEVFTRWLESNAQPTWGKILKVLNKKSVNLPNVTKRTEKMLNKRVSTYLQYSYVYSKLHVHG